MQIRTIAMTILTCGIGIVGCQRPTCAPPIIEMRQLLLDEKAYPSGWVAGEPLKDVARSEYGDVSLDDLTRPFNSLEDRGVHSTQMVWRYCSSDVAKDLYQRKVDKHGLYKGEAAFVSPSIPDFTISCGYVDQSTLEFCEAVGRYGSYVMSVFSYIDGKHMTYADFDRVLAAADGKMAQVLVNSPAATPTPGP